MLLNNEYAKIREVCPVCNQGRLFIAQTNDGKYFITCEDCESEWGEPSDVNAVVPTRDIYNFSRFLIVEDAKNHPWFKYVLNK